MGDLSPDLSLGEMARPGDDGRQPNATLKQAELRAAIRTAAAAAEMRSFLNRMAVVGLIHNDGPFPQTRLLKILHQSLYPLVQSRDKGRIQSPRKRQVTVVLQPLFIPLVRIVRHVGGGIHEERL